MAFSSKFGGLMKQSVPHNGQVPMASMLNSVRQMSVQLFVGGLSFETNNEKLKDAFSKYGKVADAVVITDRDTGISRGFGFVTFARDKDAKSAMVAMRGQALDGREIYMSVSDRPPSFSAFSTFSCCHAYLDGVIRGYAKRVLKRRKSAMNDVYPEEEDSYVVNPYIRRYYLKDRKLPKHS